MQQWGFRDNILGSGDGRIVLGEEKDPARTSREEDRKDVAKQEEKEELGDDNVLSAVHGVPHRQRLVSPAQRGMVGMEGEDEEEEEFQGTTAGIGEAGCTVVILVATAVLRLYVIE